MLSAGLSETETKMRLGRHRIITLGSMGRKLGPKEMLVTHTDNSLGEELQKLTTEMRLSEPTRVKYETAIPIQAVDGLIGV